MFIFSLVHQQSMIDIVHKYTLAPTWIFKSFFYARLNHIREDYRDFRRHDDFLWLSNRPRVMGAWFVSPRHRKRNICPHLFHNSCCVRALGPKELTPCDQLVYGYCNPSYLLNFKQPLDRFHVWQEDIHLRTKSSSRWMLVNDILKCESNVEKSAALCWFVFYYFKINCSSFFSLWPVTTRSRKTRSVATQLS